MLKLAFIIHLNDINNTFTDVLNQTQDWRLWGTKKNWEKIWPNFYWERVTNNFQIKSTKENKSDFQIKYKQQKFLLQVLFIRNGDNWHIQLMFWMKRKLYLWFDLATSQFHAIGFFIWILFNWNSKQYGL